jgi:hypothetical protein
MERAYWISLGALGGVFAVAFGCSGAGNVDSLFNEESSKGSGGNAAASTTAGVGGTTSGGTGGTAEDTSSASGGDTTGAGGSGSGDVTLPCGAEMCPIGTESACCWNRFNVKTRCVEGPLGEDGCEIDPSTDVYDTRIECSDSSQCDEQICCANRVTVNGGQFTYFDTVSCQDACDLPTGVTLCDPTSADNICPIVDTATGPVQLICKTSKLLPDGYFACGFPPTK